MQVGGLPDGRLTQAPEIGRSRRERIAAGIEFVHLALDADGLIEGNDLLRRLRMRGSG